MDGTSAINFQVDSRDKEEATNLLKDLGMNMSTYLNVAIKQLIKKGGIPFEIKNPEPNRELLEALEEGEDILNGKIKTKTYKSVKELIEDLDNDI